MASILLIEDSKNIQQKIRQILQFNNHEISYTNNEMTALKLIKNNLYDLIIMSDMVIPRMSKSEFITELKKDDLTAYIPLIFLSKKAGYQDFREGMLMGADDYIVKPFKAGDLVNSIEIQLKKKERVDSKFISLRLNIVLNLPHQLRTPLMAILGYSSLVIEESEKVGHLEIYEMTKSIQFGAQRLLKHIEKFLNYSNLRTSKNYNMK